MSNEREFSIVRRRDNLVDVLIPRIVDTTEYRFEVATNFDATYNQIFAAPQASGFLDPAVDRKKLSYYPGIDKVRAVFDPASFTGSLPNADDAHFWMRMIRLIASTGGTSTPTAGVLVPTEDERQAQQQIVIAGTAPDQVAPGLRLDLPRRMDDFNIRNGEAAAGTELLVATTLNGPEYAIGGQETWSPYFGATGCLYVRGSGGTAAFSASFTNTFPQ